MAEGEDYVVPEVHLLSAGETEASGWLVAKNRATERYYRAGWTYMDEGPGPADVEYDEKSDWTEVQEEWVPVDGDAEEMEEDAGQRKESAEQDDGEEPEEERDAPAIHDGLEERGPQLGQYQRRTYQADVRRSSDGESTTVIINTDAVDGHGTIVDPSGMRLQHGNRRFSRNFFINHDMNLLAGESPEPQYRGDALQVQVSDDAWDHEDELVERWYRKVKKGLLTQASIGFMPIDGEYTERNGERVYRYTDWMLREWSFVPIASNPEADVTSRTPASRLEQTIERVLTRKLEEVATSAPNSSDDAPASAGPSSADKDPEGSRNGSEATDDGGESAADGEPTRVLTVEDAKRLLREQKRKRREKAEKIAKRKLGMA
jgi:HK97 family phage prohead protease